LLKSLHSLKKRCIFVPTNKLKHKTMTTTNKNITIEEARELLKSVGMTYPGTEHNKKMIAQATREIIAKLHANK